MPIERHQGWGTVGPAPEGLQLVRTDAEARAIAEAARRANQPVPPLGLLGGDLCRTLGGTGDQERINGPEAFVAPADLGSVLIDGVLHWFVAHLVARDSWWRGRVFAAMNAQYLGRWDVAPRAHPGDGQLDTLDGNLLLGDRWKARSRLPLGTHVPHPGIVERRCGATQIAFERPTPIWLDGERVATARQLSIRVEADALTIVV